MRSLTVKIGFVLVNKYVKIQLNSTSLFQRSFMVNNNLITSENNLQNPYGVKHEICKSIKYHN